MSESEPGGASFGSEREARLIAAKIANGHAYRKHAAALGNMNRAEFESKIFSTLRDPTEAKHLPRGRAAYWSDRERIIVLLNPEDPDAGTAFAPGQGKLYFTNLGEP